MKYQKRKESFDIALFLHRKRFHLFIILFSKSFKFKGLSFDMGNSFMSESAKKYVYAKEKFSTLNLLLEKSLIRFN